LVKKLEFTTLSQTFILLTNKHVNYFFSNNCFQSMSCNYLCAFIDASRCGKRTAISVVATHLAWSGLFRL